MISALSKVENACNNRKFTLGYHIIEPLAALIQDKVKIGYNFIAFSTDFLFLGRKSNSEMNIFRSNK